jgi:putative ABC transport system substrate-binding protein
MPVQARHRRNAARCRHSASASRRGTALVRAVREAGRCIRLVVVAAGLIAASSIVAAQRTDKVAHIGVLCASRCEGAPGVEVLRDGLRQAGWAEGGNLRIDFRSAGGQPDRLPVLAQELVALTPDLIVALTPQPSRAAKNATSTIPIVFIGVADPVRVGLVASLARPGGNVTGIATLVPGGFMGKGLELLKEAVPKATRIAVMLNPSNEVSHALFPLEVPPAARQLGVTLHVLEVRAQDGIEAAIDAAVQQRAEALWIPGDPIFHSPAQRIPDLAARARLPTMFLTRDLAVAGGLMSYGPNFEELNRRGAVYVDKILKGAKPADLPVEQPTKFVLVINLKTVRALGLTIPQSLLLRADEVIE